MTVRFKLKCVSVTRKEGSRSKYDDVGKCVGYEKCEVYDAKFSPVYSQDPNSENKRFWDATPSGAFEVTTVKELPWEIGQEYYFDVTPV